VVSPTEILVLVLERGLGAVSQETDVPILKVDEGVRPQLGQMVLFYVGNTGERYKVHHEVVGEGVVSFPFKTNNLVVVRVVQADYLVQQPVLRSVPIFLSDSAIENCNRIFEMKNKEYEVLKVWRVGKDMGFTCFGQENIVISRKIWVA